MKRLKIPLQLAVSAIALAMVLRLVGGGELAVAVGSIPWWVYAQALLLHGLTILLCCRRWQLALKSFGVRIPYGSAVGLYFRGYFVQLFLPSTLSHDVYRVVALGYAGHERMRVTGSVLLDKLLGAIDVALLGLIPLLILGDRLQYAGAFGLFFGSLLIAGIVALTAGRYVAGRVADWGAGAPEHATKFWWRLRRLLVRVRVLGEMRFTGWMLGEMVLLMVATRLVWASTWFVLGLALGLHLPFAVFCVILPGIELTRLLPVGFNGLGIGELASMAAFSLYAVPQSVAVTMSLVMFSLTLVRAGAGWLLWLTGDGLGGLRRLREQLRLQEENA